MRIPQEIQWSKIGLVCIDWVDTLSREPPNSKRFIESILRRKLPFLVVTRSNVELVLKYASRLRLTGLEEEKVFGAADKESGQAFLEAAKRFDLRPEELLVIDDDIAAIQGALSVGVGTVVWLNNSDRDPCPEQAIEIKKLTELCSEP